MEGDCIKAIKLHCQLYFRKDSYGCLEYLDLILGGNCRFHGVNENEREAYTRGVLEGRNGKGVIFVFSAGNSLDKGDDTNLGSTSKNTRMVIPVGAVGKNGKVSFYSTPGATVFVSAPGKESAVVGTHIHFSLSSALSRFSPAFITTCRWFYNRKCFQYDDSG